MATWDKSSVPLSATAVVKRIEGFYAHPYDDNGGRPGGTWTIGYGSIFDGQDHPVTPHTAAITEAVAEAWLRRDMIRSAVAVAARVQIPLEDYEAAALISWTYNLGQGALATSTMLKKLNSGGKEAVPGEMRKWIVHEGKKLVGLLRRRWAEAAIFQGMSPTNACNRAWKEINDLDDWPSFLATLQLA